ncbi:MAG: molybdopterin-binding protein [Lachnospiraceae bacterium]|nr:molybdopterin-binding protein [Lachnospiraceae bacterium]
MKKIRVEDAVGMKLSHDLTGMGKDYKGPVFKRGHVIEEADIQTLLDIGKRTVFVGDPEPGMLHEEECALRLSEAAGVNGAHYEGPSEGKVVLVSDTKGMFVLNRKLLEEINGIGDITISTIPHHFRVEEGDRLASMRIVPLYTDKEQIEKAEELLSESRLFEILPYRPLKAGVIITGSEIYNKRIDDLFEPVVRKKLSCFPGEVLEVSICDDDTDMMLKSAKEMLEKGADLLIFAGGMSVDPDDLTPGAIKALGADIVSYGLPAQPGNMTLIAYLGDIPVLGVPGAAVNLPVTMFDVLLPQIYTGLKFTKQDVLRLAEGGLCMRCKSCHYPYCTFGRY